MTYAPAANAMKAALSGTHTALLSDLSSDARALADANGYTSANGLYDQRNAIEHTYVSAQVTHNYGPLAATLFGNVKELTSDDPLDSARDQYNNEVGRRMARWIELNGYDESAIDGLVLDALNNGELISNLNDPRITGPQPQDPTWHGPSQWHEPTQQLPDQNDDPVRDRLREAWEDVKRFFNDPFSHLPDWLHDLKDFIRGIFSDPLVLDLDGDGIELTALAGSATTFDLDDDAVAERTGWVGPHDGLLVHDANGNGVADGIGELLGSANVDGFDELETLDTNNDGRIDAADSAFAELRVWRDSNSDGISTPDEMLTLADVGIARLNLSYSSISWKVVARDWRG
jgi:hypothetical protein